MLSTDEEKRRTAEKKKKQHWNHKEKHGRWRLENFSTKSRINMYKNDENEFGGK